MPLKNTRASQDIMCIVRVAGAPLSLGRTTHHAHAGASRRCITFAASRARRGGWSAGRSAGWLVGRTEGRQDGRTAGRLDGWTAGRLVG